MDAHSFRDYDAPRTANTGLRNVLNYGSKLDNPPKASQYAAGASYPRNSGGGGGGGMGCRLAIGRDS